MSTQQLAKFLQDDKGNLSSMRLVFIGMMILIGVLTTITLFREDSMSALALFGGMYSVVAGGKLIQKSQEKKE